jgi:predicted aldo/keto reductase-like oxidoreductase
VVIATKVLARDGKGAAEQLSMSFDRLRTDRIDLIQCHNLSSQQDLERVMGSGGAYETLAEARAQGKVGVIGFSSHSPDIAVKGCSTGKFATLQFPFNFIEHDPWTRVFPSALDRGMGIIGMKPLGGGLLSRADLCFRFLQQYPAVVPLAGIQSKEEITEIVAYYRDRRPLSAEDLKAIQNIRHELGSRFCRRCEYCMPCENGVKIPRVLMIKSMARRLTLKQLVAMSREAVASAEQCVGCGECIERCPYNLPIPEMLQENLTIYRDLLSRASRVQA